MSETNPVPFIYDHWVRQTPLPARHGHAYVTLHCICGHEIPYRRSYIKCRPAPVCPACRSGNTPLTKVSIDKLRRWLGGPNDEQLDDGKTAFEHIDHLTTRLDHATTVAVHTSAKLKEMEYELQDLRKCLHELANPPKHTLPMSSAGEWQPPVKTQAPTSAPTQPPTQAHLQKAWVPLEGHVARRADEPTEEEMAAEPDFTAAADSPTQGKSGVFAERRKADAPLEAQARQQRIAVLADLPYEERTAERKAELQALVLAEIKDAEALLFSVAPDAGQTRRDRLQDLQPAHRAIEDWEFDPANY